MHGGRRSCGCSLIGDVPCTLRPGERRSAGWRPDPLCTASGGPSGPKSAKRCARPSRSFGGIGCTRAMDLFRANEARSFWQLLSWHSSGACPPATANHVATIRNPAGHTVCSDVGITSAFAHHYARLGEPSPPDTAEFDAEQMRHLQAQVAAYAVRSFDLGDADPALDAVPSRDEIAACVEKLRNHKAGTEEGIVNEMLKYGGPAILDMLAGLVGTL